MQYRYYDVKPTAPCVCIGKTRQACGHRACKRVIWVWGWRGREGRGHLGRAVLVDSVAVVSGVRQRMRRGVVLDKRPLAKRGGVAGHGLAADTGKREAADAGGGAREAEVDDVAAEAEGLEDLRALVRLQGRDAHLGHDLEDADADCGGVPGLHGACSVTDTATDLPCSCDRSDASGSCRCVSRVRAWLTDACTTQASRQTWMCMARRGV